MTAQLERPGLDHRPSTFFETISGPDVFDPRLASVLTAIEGRSLRVLSLDIFDTLLWRRVPDPCDLFCILAHRLRRAGLLADWVDDETFRETRRDAEASARTAAGMVGPEVSLRAIWNHMPASFWPSADAGRLSDLEVDLERDFTVLDHETSRLIGAAQENGIPVVLVSDTYFSERQLRELLDRPGLQLEGVSIFASSEYGVAKGSGLWDAVLATLGRTPSEIVHVGDNETADWRVPAEIGIRTVHYERIDEGFVDVLTRESTRPDPVHGDRGLTTVRARAVSAVSDSGRRVDVARRHGAGVVGPVLTGFAEWIVRSCAERGIRHVWCPMREGELLAEVIAASARARGVDLQAEPLWLSRHVTWLAGIDRVDARVMRDVIRRSYGITVRTVLEELGLCPADVPALASHLDRVLDDSEFTDRVAAALVESSCTRHRLARAAADRRDRLVRYLDASGALAESELLLVDLGWGGTIQAQLADVLRLAGRDVVVDGMYLATDHRALRLLRSGLRAEGYLGASGHPASLVPTIVRSPEALEMCVNALCGSLLGFSEQGEPVLGPPSGGPSEHEERRAVREGIRAFQDKWNSYVATSANSWPVLDDVWSRTHLGEVLRASIAAPTSAEAQLFGAWGHEDNLGSDIVTPLTPPDLLELTPYMSPADLADLRMRDAFWPALLASSAPALARALRVLEADAAAAEAFEPGWFAYTRMMLRSVDGVWHPGSRKRVRINSSGLTFARLATSAHDMDEVANGPEESEISEISLEIPGRPALVRIDRIDVVALGRSGTRHVLRWDTPDALGGLRLAECTWLGGLMFEFRAAHGAVVLPIASRVGEPVTSLRVTLGAAILPLSSSGLTCPAPAASTRARLVGRFKAEFGHHGVLGVASGLARVIVRKVVTRS